jgi:hypothetical protein
LGGVKRKINERIMKAKSIKGKSIDELASFLSDALSDGFKPTLAIVFCSINQDRDNICELLDKKGLSIFGATTNGEFIDEEKDTDSTAIILLDMVPEYFALFFDEFQNENFSEIATSIANKSLEKFQNPAFLIVGINLNTDVEEII